MLHKQLSIYMSDIFLKLKPGHINVFEKVFAFAFAFPLPSASNS